MRDFKGDQGDWALRPRAASQRAGKSSWWRRPNGPVGFVRYGCPLVIREDGWQTSGEMCGNLPVWGVPHRERLTLPDAEESVRASGGGPGAQCEGEDRGQPPGKRIATPIPSARWDICAAMPPGSELLPAPSRGRASGVRGARQCIHGAVVLRNEEVEPRDVCRLFRREW